VLLAFQHGHFRPQLRRRLSEAGAPSRFAAGHVLEAESKRRSAAAAHGPPAAGRARIAQSRAGPPPGASTKSRGHQQGIALGQGARHAHAPRFLARRSAPHPEHSAAMHLKPTGFSTTSRPQPPGHQLPSVGAASRFDHPSPRQGRGPGEGSIKQGHEQGAAVAALFINGRRCGRRRHRRRCPLAGAPPPRGGAHRFVQLAEIRAASGSGAWPRRVVGRAGERISSGSPHRLPPDPFPHPPASRGGASRRQREPCIGSTITAAPAA